jgi:PAS domain S-box-containing protein/putative nucleotidyltransferase with HDIG domain
LKHLKKDKKSIEVPDTGTKSDRRPAAFVNTEKDMERDRASEKLRENEGFFRTSFENANIGASLLGTNGRYLRVNKQMAAITGYSQQELLELKFNDITYPEDRWIGDEYIKKVITGEIEETSFMKRYVHKSGSVIWCLVLVGTVRSNEGKPLYLVSYVQDITRQRLTEEKLEQSLKQMNGIFNDIIGCLGYTIEIKDPYTSGHQRRVAALAAEIAREMGLPDDKTEAIRIAGTIHDIGKISIPGDLLNKPGALTEIETAYISQHSENGYLILKKIHFPWPIAEIVRQHHERINGSGYPRGLKGNEIMTEAKIIGAADVVEAMSSHRPYRPSLGIRAALEELIKKRGILYDEVVVDACVRLFREKKYELPK